MKHWIFFISTLAVAYCRPQFTPQDSSAVEIEKQDVIEILSKTKQLDESTKQILAKIAQVNEKQGLNKKKPRPYQNLPFGYQRSEEHFNNRQGSDFKFPRDPFTNPILEYIERKGSDIEANLRTPTKENNAENEEIPFGHYIKRKITHQQTMVVPNRGYLPPNMVPTQQNLPQPFFPNPLQGGIKTDLEKQTVNNIKNIVENSRHPPFSSNYQPLFTPYGYPQPSQNFDGVYQLYGPYAPQSVDRPEKLRQWQWPLAEYFPIVIKDPVMHMFQAFTTMVEYGPQGSGNAGDACKKHGEAKQADVASPKAKKIDEEDKLSYSVTNNGKGAEITVTNDDNSNLTTVIDIEDLAITDNRESPLEMKLNYRQSKQDHDTAENQNSSLIDLLSNPLIQTVEITQQKLNDTSRESPPTRDQVLYEDEIFEDEKAENVQVSHSGTKKLVSKDNTGTGIFVHKIKVRKGGVAIAGPGGIATAGSGGTAIVGPNGFAYTHPDSLAIAGSGTKVVAVEPTISLSQVVADHNKNKTRGEGHTFPRVGKIVAVGPVIYYNKG